MPWIVKVYVPGSKNTIDDLLGQKTVRTCKDIIKFTNKTLEEKGHDEKITTSILRNYNSPAYREARPMVAAKYNYLQLTRVGEIEDD